jgi:cysteine desulfurase
MPDVSIYLDHNATTPISPAVADAMRDCQLRLVGNAASQHAAGRAARRELEAVRERLLELMGAGPDDRLIFTSGGTESNNLALRGLLATERKRLVISSIEHPSVEAVATQLALAGHEVERLPVDSAGRTQHEDVVISGAGLVSVMLGNNETGVLQPLVEIAAACARHGVPLHSDATQVIGKLPVSFCDLGLAAMTFTAHKFHGPVGIGALVVRRGVELAPLLVGQAGYERPGTAAVALAVGMGAALEAWREEWSERAARMGKLRDELEERITTSVPEAVVIGREAPRLPHTANIAFVGFDRQQLHVALDLAGIACSTGSACASGSSEPSPVLLAMGLPEAQIQGSLRFSLGAGTTAAEIEEAAKRISLTCKHLRHAKSR